MAQLGSRPIAALAMCPVPSRCQIRRAV